MNARDSATLDLAPIARIEGVVPLPGSKSISNRTLLLSALARGTTALSRLLDADDTARMIDALRALGVRIDRADDRCVVHGVGGAFPNRGVALFLGNAGTAVRPLTAVLAMLGGAYTVAGTPRMHERPIGDLVDALRHQGCDLRYTAKEGYPPLAIGATDGHAGGVVRIRGDVSSQFVSALLMSLPVARGAHETATTIELTTPLISRPYVEITTGLMRRFGAVVETPDESTFRVAPTPGYRSPGEVTPVPCRRHFALLHRRRRVRHGEAEKNGRQPYGSLHSHHRRLQ
jgi:3-phosphoshikimate 1-carboxyvinyltransferase